MISKQDAAALSDTKARRLLRPILEDIDAQIKEILKSEDDVRSLFVAKPENVNMSALFTILRHEGYPIWSTDAGFRISW